MDSHLLVALSQTLRFEISSGPGEPI